ncbi:transforming growth factor beta regulator 1 [Apophysomyces ossiformis]|uniref:Transforming growth factor beta regulator 1 n=1 Tax=Apophysomyces ossiformis TaxID=679940 RepID=A0A8H7BP65_9FUNG|nr:transforming growth factor beta regulator 1 [Apophysomyces ossiformis]
MSKYRRILKQSKSNHDAMDISEDEEEEEGEADEEIDDEEEDELDEDEDMQASLTILNLGKVVWDRAAFHSERYIWPVGYCVERVEEDQDAPLFTIRAADAPDQELSAKTPTGAWALVIKRANEIRHKESANAISGPEYYGFAHPLVIEMIEELDGVDKCSRYVLKRESNDAIVTPPAEPLSPPPDSTHASLAPINHNNKEQPMTLEERRQRNKIASAKYRAKKQASLRSMTARLSQLTTANASLQRDLAQAKQENEALRRICKAFMTEQQQQQKKKQQNHSNAL